MDAGVVELHVFQHDAAYEPMRIADGDQIVPRLFANAPVKHRADISLVVPTFHNATLKQGALEHLLEGIEACRSIREVILVAADGDTSALGFLRDACNIPVTIVSCEPNRRAQARNVGVEAATHDVIVFLDDDMLLQDWTLVESIFNEMMEGSYEAALFPRRQFVKFPVLYDKQLLRNAVGRWRRDQSDLPNETFLDPLKHGSPFKTMAFCFPGCFMMITRKAFADLGGFPEEFEGWGFEDSDFAMKAVRQLNVLNLFRAAPPLLHIDHPVSPYKSDEYRKNLKQFYNDYNVLDMDWLCKVVFEGDDFRRENRLPDSRSIYMKPIKTALGMLDFEVDAYPIQRNFEHVLSLRVKRGLDPVPAFIAITGSRGSKRHGEESDYDLLTLFRGGAYSDHFVMKSGGLKFDVENAGLGKFEELASAPVANPMRGPLELAKLAQARLLFGEQEEFARWRGKVLEIAIQVGLPVWLLCGIGMRLNSKRFLGTVDPYFEAIDHVLNECFPSETSQRELVAATIQDIEEPAGMPIASTSTNSAFDTALFAEDRLDELILATRELLDRKLDGWRADMADHKRVFALQIPEIWNALYELLERE